MTYHARLTLLAKECDNRIPRIAERYRATLAADIRTLTAELERVERERDEALRMWPDGKLPSEYTCLTGDGWVLAGDRQSIDRVIRQDHEARAHWPATVERLKAAEARATAAEARLASAVGVIGILAGFAEALAEADLDELAADGGVTVGMVFQQQARDVMARRARAFMEQQG